MRRRIAVAGLPFFAQRSAEGLREAGFEAHYLPRPSRSPASWWRFAVGLRSTELVYTIGSSAARNSPADLVARTGKRMLMHWVGTDVTAAQPDHAAGRLSARLVRGARHWTDAPWLVEELKELGIFAEVHTLPVPTAIGEVQPLPDVFRVLVYLPARPHGLYDVESTLAVMRALPGVRFVLVGGYVPAGPAISNLELRGYVHDMPAVYADCVAMLRLTLHDGLSHSVIEALSFGRYVFWTYPLSGVTPVRGVDEAVAAIRELERQFVGGGLRPNEAGAAAVTQEYRWCTVRDEIRTAMESLFS